MAKYFRSAAYKAKMSLAIQAMWKDPVERAKRLEQRRSPEYRAKMSASLKLRVLTPLHKARIGLAHKGKVYGPETRAKIAASHIGKPLSDEHKLKIKIGGRLTGGTAKSRKKKSLVHKKLWANPVYAKASLSRMLRACGQLPNKPEIRVGCILEKVFPKDWKYTGKGEVVIGGKIPDFVNVNGRKAVIEVFGRYWHQRTDAATRTKHFKRYGFSTLCVWEDITEADFVSRVQKKFNY